VHVDETGDHVQSAGVDHAPPVGAAQIADRGNRVAEDPYVRSKLRIPGSIEYPTVLDEHIERLRKRDERGGGRRCAEAE
jgi:hypothetical protein